MRQICNRITAGEPDGLRGRAEQALRLAAVDPATAEARAAAVLRDAVLAGDGIAAALAEQALGKAARTQQDMVGSAGHLAQAIRWADRSGAVELAGKARVSRALPLAYLGRFGAAFAELDRAEQALPGTELGRVELQRAAVLQLQGRLDQADGHYTRAQRLLTRAEDRELLAALYNNRGQLRSRRGQLAAAEHDLRQAVALHLEVGHQAAAAETGQNLGLIAARRGDVIAALTAFDEVDRYLAEQDRVDPIGLVDRSEALLTARLLVEARATAERALREEEIRHLSTYVSEARLILARIAVYDGHPAEAQELATQAAHAFARQRRPSYRALAEEVRIRAVWLSGDRSARLLAASRRTAAALEANGWLVAGADARLIAAQVALDCGRPGVARAELAGLTTPRRSDPAELRSRAFYARALLLLADGEPRRAEASLRAGMAVVERHRQALGGTELRLHASAHAADLANLGLRLALRDSDPARVLRWAERWRAGALALPSVRPPEDQELADALAALRAASSSSGADGGNRSDRSYRYRLAALERTVQRLARRVRATDIYQPKPAPAAAVQAVLGERALVEFIDIAGEMYAVVLTAGRRSLHHLGPTGRLGNSVLVLRMWLRRLIHQRGSPELLRRAERTVDEVTSVLDELLLRPLAARLEDRPLVIVPTARLHALPWTMLPSCMARPVSIAPSATWWRQAATTEEAGRHNRGPAVLASGPGLAWAPTEVAELSRFYPGATCLTGEAATAAAAADALDGADMAHIAAHGTFRADQPLLSSLHLADGPLTVYDLERLRQAPRLLVLASCDAGLSKVLPGDELMGLAACLLAQGTVALVAPVLPVRDDEAHQSMLAFHQGLRAGQTPAAALMACRAELADEPRRYAVAVITCLGAG
jgi:tetratricopeptide (TPR) repeat protein